MDTHPLMKVPATLEWSSAGGSERDSPQGCVRSGLPSEEGGLGRGTGCLPLGCSGVSPGPGGPGELGPPFLVLRDLGIWMLYLWLPKLGRNQDALW